MLHDEIAWDFEDGVSHGEERDSQGIAMWCQTRVREHVVARFGVEHAGISNVSCCKCQLG